MVVKKILGNKKSLAALIERLVMGEVIDGKSKANNKCTDAQMQRGYLAIHDLHSKNFQIRFLMLFISLLYVNSRRLQRSLIEIPTGSRNER